MVSSPVSVMEMLHRLTIKKNTTAIAKKVIIATAISSPRPDEFLGFARFAGAWVRSTAPGKALFSFVPTAISVSLSSVCYRCF
jgi:hypothetical protein